MIEISFIIILVALFTALCVVGIIAIKYYLENQSIKNDRAKYVVLRDLNGQMKKIGRFYSIAPVDNQLAIQVIPVEHKGMFENWTFRLEDKFASIGAFSMDYGQELMILTDFKRTDFKNKVIYPLVDISILTLGLTRGLETINEKILPLYAQIEKLKTAVEERDREMQKQRVEYDEGRLKYFNELKTSVKVLIDEVQKELILVPQFIQAKLVTKREEYFGQPGSSPPSLKSSKPYRPGGEELHGETEEQKSSEKS